MPFSLPYRNRLRTFCDYIQILIGRIIVTLPHNIKPKKKMKKSILQTIVLAALLALPTFAKAQTFAGITEEQSAQNTPEGWTAVALPQLPALLRQIHLILPAMVHLPPLRTTPRLSKRLLMPYLLPVVWSSFLQEHGYAVHYKLSQRRYSTLQRTVPYCSNLMAHSPTTRQTSLEKRRMQPI